MAGRQGRELPSTGSLPQRPSQARRAALVAVPGSVTACRPPDKPLLARQVWGHTRRSSVQGQHGPSPPGHSGKDQGKGLSSNALLGWWAEGA